jgi:Ca2+-binding EF-hand superfamily protein
MARDALRVLLVGAVLVLLAFDADAQRGGGRGGRKRGAAAAAPTSPKAGGGEALPPLTIPGMPAAGGAKKDGPDRPSAGPAAKATPKKDEPFDPMEAADLVTAAADHGAVRAEADVRLLREHFGMCDLDGNGWLSLRETEVTLSLVRDEYRRADANQDGRLDPAEFEGQQELMLARLGARAPAAPSASEAAPARELPADPLLVPPEPGAPAARKPGGRRATRPESDFATLLLRPIDLLRRYDLDRSKGIGVSELDKLFSEIGLALSPELVVAQMDPNTSGELTVRELTPLAWLASQNLPESLRPDTAPAQPEGARALADEVPLPAQAVRTHFDLLDAGRDAFIDEADLRTLQKNVRLEVRLRTVLSALDTDGDGRLSEAEFRGSMRRRVN